MPGSGISGLFRGGRLACLVLLAALCAAGPARAQVGSDRYASIVVDAASGNVLSAANPDEPRYPASLTKMMTIYLLFEAVRDRRVAMTDLVPVSPSASSMPPTKLGLLPGTVITVEQCLLGLVTKSANDAATALGEMMGGDEERFAQIMTLRARALGMAHTTFRNASGLPDWGQVTTARDMAVLARHLIQDFPAYYHYFSTPSFPFQGRTIYSHQRMLQNYPGADGLKTGYIEASGYNVVTSALRSDVRLIGVVLGAGSGGERDLHAAVLLDQGFERMGVTPMIARREPAYRLPSMIASASAATRSFVAPVQVAEAARPLPRGVRALRSRQPFARQPVAQGDARDPRADFRPRARPPAGMERMRPVLAEPGYGAPRLPRQSARSPVWYRSPG